MKFDIETWYHHTVREPQFDYTTRHYTGLSKKKVNLWTIWSTLT